MSRVQQLPYARGEPAPPSFKKNPQWSSACRAVACGKPTQAQFGKDGIHGRDTLGARGRFLGPGWHPWGSRWRLWGQNGLFWGQDGVRWPHDLRLPSWMSPRSPGSPTPPGWASRGSTVSHEAFWGQKGLFGGQDGVCWGQDGICEVLMVSMGAKMASVGS